jgi:hypothetical protein
MQEWHYLENRQIKLGIKISSGAAIGWFSPAKSTRNLLNHWDKGRLIQQSYYGNADGSLWDKQPWRWNPVQGGDWVGNPARVLETKPEKYKFYARTMGRHWAAQKDLPEVIFEEWISLEHDVAKIKYRMTYTGTETHANRDHEIPAVFLEPDLDTLVLYEGDRPRTNAPVTRLKPGWPNEGHRMTEHWAAYVDKDDFGLGVLVPRADKLTCYRFGDGKPEHGSCSYFAPLTQFPITPGTIFEYEMFLTCGTSIEIRKRLLKK